MPCLFIFMIVFYKKKNSFVWFIFFQLCQIRGGNSNTRADNPDSVTFTIECVRNLPIFTCIKKTSPVTPFFLFLIWKHNIGAIFSNFISKFYGVVCVLWRKNEFSMHNLNKNCQFWTTCCEKIGPLILSYILKSMISEPLF